MDKAALSPQELSRYDRQMMIDGFGLEGQQKLKKAKVFIAGAGGLGSPVSIYLAVAGVGHIRIIDRDVVDLSNLNRQILHWNQDVGRAKADSAGDKLRGLNPDIKVEAIREEINASNVAQLIEGFDVVVDAMDNFATRYLLNACAVEKRLPFFHGGIYGMSGNVTTVIPGRTACLRCIFPEPPPAEKFPVIGVAPAVIGCIQATEVIKYIVGIGNLLTNRLLMFDGTNLEFTEVRIRRKPACVVCGTCH